jgi:hypothetical protein
MASLPTSEAGKLASLETIGFGAENAMYGVTKMLLPGGAGKIAVNIYTTNGNPVLQKFLKDAFVEPTSVAPVLNFPATSVLALKTFSELIGKLEERASFFVSSPLTELVATKSGLSDPGRPVKYLPLVSGDYIFVPRAHAESLTAGLSDLELERGFLVTRGAPKSQALELRAKNAVPDVTYATLKVSVTALPADR